MKYNPQINDSEYLPRGKCNVSKLMRCDPPRLLQESLGLFRSELSRRKLPRVSEGCVRWSIQRGSVSGLLPSRLKKKRKKKKHLQNSQDICPTRRSTGPKGHPEQSHRILPRTPTRTLSGTLFGTTRIPMARETPVVGWGIRRP